MAYGNSSGKRNTWRTAIMIVAGIILVLLLAGLFLSADEAGDGASGTTAEQTNPQ
jgi:type IV secretory pathway VirB2 component (pilin)